MFDSTTIGSIHPLVTRTHLFGPIGEDGQPITEASDLPEQRALRGETVEDVVLGLPNVQNREMCWVSLNAAPVRDADNQVVGAVLTAIDISGRVLAEQARRASEERYRALVEATPSAIVVADMDTRISMVTPQAVTLFGCKTADDLLGRSIFELIAPEDHEKAQHKIALALEHGSGRAEYTLLRCDGTRFLAALNAAIICDEEGRPQAITGVIRDITEERRAETQLRRSEERYRAIVEVSPDGIAQVTADLLCTIIVVNQRTLAMLDYCEEELLGRSAFDFIAREDHEKARADLDRIISLGHVDNAQYTLVRRDGSRFPAELSARMIANENGVPQSIIAVLRDISARKAAEGKIRSANERIVETLESITDAFVACDRNWRYTYVNERAAQMLGIPRDQLIGRNMWEMFPDVVNTPVYRACHQMMRERLPLTVEAFDWIKRRWYRNDIYPTREGLSIYWRDITERREVEEALRLSEERFRRYFELGLIGMAITSPDKTFLEVNDELCNMLGYDHDELVGLTWAELTPPDDLDTDLSQYERVLAGEIDGYALDKRYIRKDGQLIHATISVKCVRRADASIDYFIALLQDITERKAAEQEQARLLDAMEQLSRQLLLAQENERRHIARELHDEAGQSLTALKIQLEMLKADLLSANAALEHRLGTAVAMVDTTMERMRSLALALRPPALDALGLNAALEGYAQSFAEHTSLVVDYAAVELPIVPDTVAICLYRFLQEALTNIAKHAHARHVWIVLQRDAEEISLLVEDDGEGFDRARLRSSARRLTQLGLLGMRERLQLLGGRLDIDLRPERGVRLVAHIPRKEGL